MSARTLAVVPGDLFQSSGRRTVVWVVDSVVRVPNAGPQVRLSQLDGVGKLTVPLAELDCGQGFRRIVEASLPQQPKW